MLTIPVAQGQRGLRGTGRCQGHHALWVTDCSLLLCMSVVSCSPDTIFSAGFDSLPPLPLAQGELGVAVVPNDRCFCLYNPGLQRFGPCSLKQIAGGGAHPSPLRRGYGGGS